MLHLLDCIQLKTVWFHVFVLIMSLLQLCVVYFHHMSSLVLFSWQASSQQLKFTTSDSCDRIKDEFQFLQAQYHRCRQKHWHAHWHTNINSRGKRLHTPVCATLCNEENISRLYMYHCFFIERISLKCLTVKNEQYCGRKNLPYLGQKFAF